MGKEFQSTARQLGGMIFHGCHIRVNQTFHFTQGQLTIPPVHPVVPPEHRMGLMPAYAHYYVVGHTRLPEVRDRAMPEVVKMKILDPGLAARPVKGGPNAANALPFPGKHVGASQGPGGPLEQLHQRPAQGYLPFLQGLRFLCGQDNDPILEVDLVPLKT